MQRQQALDATARREFDRSKKLQKQSAIISTGLAVISAAAQTPGPWWVKLAAALAAGELGRRQVQAIDATQFDGGGSISTVSPGGGAGGGGGTTDSGRPDQNINIQFFGNVIGSEIKGMIVDAIKEASDADNLHISVLGERAQVEVAR